MHEPLYVTELPTTSEEAMIIDDDIMNTGVPELCYHEEDSDSESGDSLEEEEQVLGEFEEELEEIQRALEDSDGSLKPTADAGVRLRRSMRENTGKKSYDDAYDWYLMNLSVGAAVQSFRDVARSAIQDELLQLFIKKGALILVHRGELSPDQKKRAVRLHMFIGENFEDGQFIKMKAKLVAGGMMQDRSVYSNYSSPTTKTHSVMMCLKIAAIKKWDLLKLDVRGAFLCASINEDKEVYMFLDTILTGLAIEHMPEYQEYVREDDKLIVRVDKTMYGLIQNAKLWYNELMTHLTNNGFKICPSDECILVKKHSSGRYIVVILYADDILVLSGDRDDRYYVKDLLEGKYEKIMVTEGDRLPYLGMTNIKSARGFEICMKSYIDDVLRLHGKQVREYVTPAKQNIFEVRTMAEGAELLREKARFHSIVAKLLYLGNRGRPDILMLVQFFCTRVRNLTLDDERKLERILGYLRLTSSWTRAMDDSPFD